MPTFTISAGSTRTLPLFSYNIAGFGPTGTHILDVLGNWNVPNTGEAPLFAALPHANPPLNNFFGGTIANQANWSLNISGDIAHVGAGHAPTLAFANGAASLRNEVRLASTGSITAADTAIYASANTVIYNRGDISAEFLGVLFDAPLLGAAPPNFSNITAASSLTLTNYSTGSIISDNTGVSNFTYGWLRLTNYGVIESTVNDNDFYTFYRNYNGGAAMPFSAVASVGQVSLSNSGQIDGGILLGYHTNTITNTGDMNSTVAALIMRNGAGIVDVNRDGDFTDAGDVAVTALVGTSITNSGTWVAMSENGIDTVTGAAFTDEWAFLGNDAKDVITNSGQIIGALEFAAGADLLTNTGTISGDDFPYTIYMGDGNDTVTNSGLIGVPGLRDGLPASGANAYVNLIDEILFASAPMTVEDTLVNRPPRVVFLDGGDDRLTNTGQIWGLVDGGEGNDRLTGGTDTDLFYENAGRDFYNLGNGADGMFLRGEDFAIDILDGGLGLDVLVAQDFANDNGPSNGVYVNLGTGLMRYGTLGATGLVEFSTQFQDRIANFEQVIGTNGKDSIYGSASADTLIGMDGNDLIEGRGGADHLIGFAGSDSFIYRAATESGVLASARDIIWDFATGDNIRILFDTNASVSGVQTRTITASTAFAADFSGAAGSMRKIVSPQSSIIELDINGDLVADFAIEFDYGII